MSRVVRFGAMLNGFVSERVDIAFVIDGCREVVIPVVCVGVYGLIALVACMGVK
jgi:hypothetical protein